MNTEHKKQNQECAAAQPIDQTRTETDAWNEQAKDAIKQGMSLNAFVLSSHHDNRKYARRAYLRAVTQ